MGKQKDGRTSEVSHDFLNEAVRSSERDRLGTARLLRRKPRPSLASHKLSGTLLRKRWLLGMTTKSRANQVSTVAVFNSFHRAEALADMTMNSKY
jgi:hypothetical protein